MNLGKSKTPPSSTTAIPSHTTSALPYVTVPDNEGDRCDNADDLRSLLVLCSQEKLLEILTYFIIYNMYLLVSKRTAEARSFIVINNCTNSFIPN